MIFKIQVKNKKGGLFWTWANHIGHPTLNQVTNFRLLL
jgi:hypothetical protein